MNIWLPETSLAQMRAEASHWSPLETGGILLGYVSESDEIVVTTAIGSGPKAKRTETRYVHDVEYEIAQAERLYMKSGKPDLYLGDWHTHPGGRGLMSWLDRKTLLDIAKSGTALHQPIMLILEEPAWGVCAWRFRRQNLLRLPVIALMEVHVY